MKSSAPRGASSKKRSSTGESWDINHSSHIFSYIEKHGFPQTLVIAAWQCFKQAVHHSISMSKSERSGFDVFKVRHQRDYTVYIYTYTQYLYIDTQYVICIYLYTNYIKLYNTIYNISSFKLSNSQLVCHQRNIATDGESFERQGAQPPRKSAEQERILPTKI